MGGLSTLPSVVLVHGGFVDGAGWESVYNILKKDGYNVSIVQNPTTSLADDVAATRLAIARTQGPVILVGHSYGGAVITEAGTDPKVAGLVYITAFAPDKGESVDTLIKNPPPGAPVPPILPPVDGYLFLDKDKFRASFAADVGEAKAAFMADFAGPLGGRCSRRSDQRARLEVEAELVPGRDRGQDDPAARAAPDGNARRRDRCRSRRQPRDLCLQAGRGGRAHCAGGEVRERQDGGRLTKPDRTAGLHVGRPAAWGPM